MRVGSCRNFSMSDAVVLVAAIALALVAMRSEYLWPDFSGMPTTCSDWLHRVHYFTFLMTPGFACLSLAVLVLRLRRPRPILRRLARQPGFVACTATAIVLGIRMANLASVGGVLRLDLPGHSFWGHILEDGMRDSMESIPSDVGCAVAVAWTIQGLGGRWRPEPSWIDRTGRVLGAFWIATIPFAYFTYMING